MNGRDSHRPIQERFWARVERGDDCWKWIGRVNSEGYGVLERQRRIVGAHRLSYEIHIGPIPSGMFVCHRCDNPSCVRPDHLFLGTPKDNSKDMVSKGRAMHQRPEMRGRMTKGEQIWAAKLSEGDVLEMRKLHREGVTFESLSARYGVKSWHARAVVAGRYWRHLPGAVALPSQVILTPDTVALIRASRARHTDLAREYGVSETTIRDVRTGRRWRGVSAK